MSTKFNGRHNESSFAILLGLLLSYCASLLAVGAAAVEPRVLSQAEPFALTDVRLLPGPFHDAMTRDRDYLLSLDPDRLLHMFRVTAGLPSDAKPYGGWEEPKCELRGHSLGHYLTACSLMYATTGDSRLKARVDTIVPELAKCQQALAAKGYHRGYLSAYPEEFFDRVYARKPVWAPFYTLHKIMAGLLDANQLCGNAQALDVLQQLADWVKTRVDSVSPEQQQAMLGAEFGGMNEVLANLYGVTGNPEHLRLARAFDHKMIFEPLRRGEDRLAGLHANTQIPKIIGAAREYELTGEQDYARISRFFWERVAEHHSYVIGGHSDHEHFFPITDFEKHLSPETCETCNTYNMLKLTRHLFSWEPSARFMDFYERALFNHILASQEPTRGMFVYLMSLKPGHFKSYSTPEDSFWCCVGTGMENHAKYVDSIYSHGPDSLYVNLFIASELSWKEKGLKIRQETGFPESATSRLTMTCKEPVRLALKLRWPAWCPDLTLRLNGQDQKPAGSPGSYVTLDRTWADGDKLQIAMPMPLRTETLPNSSNWIAFVQGPIVLAGELGTNDMPNVFVRNQTDLSRVPDPAVPTLAAGSARILDRVRPARQPLTWRTDSIGRPSDVTLTPFYKLHHERYSVYWQLVREEAAR